MVIADLFKTASRKRKLINSLEQAFAQDKKLLMVAVCALNHWPVADIYKHLQFTRSEVQVLLHHANGAKRQSRILQ